MAQLVIEGLEVEVTIRSNYAGAAFGDFARAKSGRMRSDIMGHHRTMRFSTLELTTAQELALRTLLQSPGPLRCWGDYIGVAADFHAFGFSSQPLTADRHVVDFDLHETNSLASSPLLFSFRGDAPGDYSIARAGTAYYDDENGQLASVAANVARFSYPLVDGVRVPAYLGEAARTNLITSLDLTVWSKIGSPTVIGGQADPAGGADAYLLAGTVNSDFIARSVTLTGDDVKAFSIYVKEGPSSAPIHIKFRDLTASVDRWTRTISFTDGVPSVPDALFITEGVDGWYRIGVQTAAVVAANSNRIEIFVDAGEDVYLYWPQVENAPVPSSPIVASGTRPADVLVVDWPAYVGAGSWYVKFIERGTTLTAGFPRLWEIQGTSGKQLNVRHNTGTAGGYGFAYEDGANPDTTGGLAGSTSPEIDDVVELLLTVDDVGDFQLTQAINGDTAVSTTKTATARGFEAWTGAPVIQFNSSVGGSPSGQSEILAFTHVTDVRDLATMRAFAAARLHPRVA